MFSSQDSSAMIAVNQAFRGDGINLSGEGWAQGFCNGATRNRVSPRTPFPVGVAAAIETLSIVCYSQSWLHL